MIDLLEGLSDLLKDRAHFSDARVLQRGPPLRSTGQARCETMQVYGESAQVGYLPCVRLRHTEAPPPARANDQG